MNRAKTALRTSIGLLRDLTRRLVGLVAIASVCACARGIVVGSYQIDDGRPNVPPSSDGNEGAYWSAYLEIEGQDISRLWNLDGLDYVLITAEVSIPTTSGPLVRSVPLFTVEKGMVNYESGVDLLKKMPLHTNARDQVTFQLQITLLDDIEALKATRKILGTVSELAKPFLNSYPLASKILESSLPLIDQFAKPSKKPASSVKTAIVAERLFRDAGGSPNQDVLFAYFLMPQRADVTAREGSDDASKNTHIKPWLLQRLEIEDKEKVLRECADKDGYLCMADAVDDFDPSDESKVWFAYDIARTRLWNGDCVADATRLYGELYTRLKEGDTTKDTLDAGFEALRSTCTKLAESLAKNDLDSIYTRQLDLESLLETSFQTLADHFRNDALPTQYMYDRVDQVAYVTIKFKRYSEVHDPFMIIDSAGDDCGTLTASRVSEVENYIRDNESLFLPEHIDYARSLVTAANDYLELVELVDRGAYSEALGLIVSRTILAEERAWNPNRDRTPRTLRSASNRLDSCFARKLAIPPYAQIAQLGRLYISSDTKRASRLNDLLKGLQDAALILGDEPPTLGSPLDGKLSESPIVKALFEEAKRLRGEELAEAGSTNCEALKGQLEGYFSKTCNECLAKLEERCGGVLGRDLEQLRKEPRGSQEGADTWKVDDIIPW
jgi:hypothetical protein